MQKIQDTSIHVAIHSVLQGDHGLVEKVKLLNPSVIIEPNFQDELENQLRFAIFSSKRKWIADTLSFNTSMSIQELTMKEALGLLSPFKDISIKQLLVAYQNAYKKKSGFKLGKLRKTKKDVLYVRALVDFLKENPESDLFSKTLIKDNRVMDGTHRLLAFLWHNQKTTRAIRVFYW